MQVTNRELARRLARAEKSGDDETIILAQNEICARLSIPLDQTEQGLTPEASNRIDAFLTANV